MKHMFCFSLILNVYVTYVSMSFALQQQHNLAHRHEDTITAQVRLGNDLCEKEKSALRARQKKVATSLNRFMETTIPTEQLPSIGLVCTGGSFRAAITTLGLLQGLEQIGLLDAVSYVSAASGSTWSLASWLTCPMSLDELVPHLKENFKSTLSIQKLNKHEIAKKLLAKVFHNRPVSLNDLWGALLAQVFLSPGAEDAQKVMLSQGTDRILSGTYPITIFLSVIGQTTPWYQWAEISPFEIGSSYLNAWIQTDHFGKSFKYGTSSCSMPGESCGYLLGMLGSAYAAAGLDIILAIKNYLDSLRPKNSLVQTLLEHLSSFEDSTRISPPQAHNFTYKLKDHPLSHERNLTFIDAGFSFNIPFPALLRRNVKIYIVCDATIDGLTEFGNDMRDVEKYAQENNYVLPPIDYKKLISQKISIFSDTKNHAAPIIIYIPSFEIFPTLKFEYTPEEFDRLAGSIRDTVVINKEMIQQAIRLALPA